MTQPGDKSYHTKSSNVSIATGAESSTHLKVGSIYRGEVVSQEPDGTYSVRLEAPKETVHGVRIALPVFGGLMGFNVKTKIMPNTMVELSYGNPSFIHCVIPNNPADWLNAGRRSTVWGDAVRDTKDVTADIAEDMIEGELEIGNMFGVAMQFLTTLIRMNAGDRAAVETHLINDMVRIISAQYRHFSGIGEDLIFDHGRPTLERTWSSYRHELMNKLKEGEPFADLKGDAVDKSSLEEGEKIRAMGRYRLLEFVGFAGDFIHSFISDPPTTAAQMLSENASTSEKAGSGKSWIHRNSDGSVLVQSVADIRLERVCRIPVPARIASHEDPAITEEREYTKLNRDFMKLAEFGSTEKKNAYRNAYHLRSYSRWLSRVHAVARMLQLSSEYRLHQENFYAAPSWTNLEDDKEKVNSATEYFDAFACISILRDGSIVMHDGYGSSVTMSNGNVQVSASRHLDLEAAGDIRMVAGGSLFVKARRNIEMSAFTGGLILHSYAWFKTICERGTVWLRSNAITGTGASTTAREDGPKPEVYGDQAILIEATEGSTALRSDKRVAITIEGNPADREKTTETHDFTVKTNGNIHMAARGSSIVSALADVVVSCSQSIGLAGRRLYSNVTELDFAKNFLIKTGVLHVNAIQTNNIKSNYISGPEVGPRSTGPKSVEPHINHVYKNSGDIEVKEGENEDGIDVRDYAASRDANEPQVPWKAANDGPEWKFSPDSEYSWDPRDETKGALTQTLTQQYLTLDVQSGQDPWGGNGYRSWNWASGTLTGRRTARQMGFGYKSVAYKTTTGSNLHVPTSQSASAIQSASQSLNWQAGSVTFKALER